MRFSDVERDARLAYERGDALGALRLYRDFLLLAPGPTDRGRTHVAIAELFIRVGSVGAARIRSELEQARHLLAGSPEHLSLALLVSTLAACAENDERDAKRWLRQYITLCEQHPGEREVTRWRGHFTHLLGRMARARGDFALAIRYYQQALSEFRRFEPDRQEAKQLVRIACSWLAWLSLRVGDLEEARRYLDACDGPVFSTAWEAVRSCCEVEYHLAVDNLTRAQFWLSLAGQWNNPSAEAMVRVLYCRALVARAKGNLPRARELALEVRRLAATHKQDHFMPEIRQLLLDLAAAEQPAGAGSV